MIKSRIKTDKKRIKQTDLIHYLGAALWAIFGIFLVLAACSSFLFGRLVFSDDAESDGADCYTYEIEITKGESAIQVGRELEKNGIIRSGLAFFVQTKLYDCTLPVGRYTVSSNMSSKEIAKYLGQKSADSEEEESE